MDRKKIAAATAAVMTYIKTQEEAAYPALSHEETFGKSFEGAGPIAAVRLNAWGMAGRSDQMQVRSMMQMGLFK